MRQYIETLTNVDPDWQAGASSREPKQKQGGAGGPVFSTMRDPEAEQQQVRIGWMPTTRSAPTNLLHPFAAVGLVSTHSTACGVCWHSSCCCPPTDLDTTFAPGRQAGSGGSSSSIQEAAGQGDLATLQTLLSSGTAVDSRDESGCTALHFAADRGQQEAVQALLAAGADVNAIDDDQQTPLHYAAMCGHQEVGCARFWCCSGLL